MAGLLAMAVAGDARAQDVPLTPPANFEQGANLAYGGFDFFNRHQAGLQATSNIRQDPTEQADMRTILALSSGARSTWSRHALAVTGSYVRQEAIETKEQETDALSGSISGRVDIGDEWSVNGGLLHTETIVGQNDPEQFAGNLQGTTVEDTVELGLSWKGKPWFANLLSRVDELDNETDIDVTTLARVQAQDRTEFDSTLQVGRTFDWGQAYVFGGPIAIEYTGSEVVLPEDRDSVGVRGGFDIEANHGPWRGLLRVGAFTQEYNAGTIGRATSFFGSAQLSWQATPSFQLAGKAQRSFDETNIEGSAGLFTNLFSVGFLYQPVQDVYLRAGPSYRYYQIEGTAMTAHTYSADAQIAWQVHPRIELLVNGTIYNQTVNDAYLANLEYGEAAVTFSTVLTF